MKSEVGRRLGGRGHGCTYTTYSMHNRNLFSFFFPFSFFFFNNFIYFFGCAGSLLLHRLFSSVARDSYSLVVVCELLTVVAPPGAEHGF